MSIRFRCGVGGSSRSVRNFSRRNKHTDHDWNFLQRNQVVEHVQERNIAVAVDVILPVLDHHQCHWNFGIVLRGNVRSNTSSASHRKVCRYAGAAGKEFRREHSVPSRRAGQRPASRSILQNACLARDRRRSGLRPASAVPRRHTKAKCWRQAVVQAPAFHRILRVGFDAESMAKKNEERCPLAAVPARSSVALKVWVTLRANSGLPFFAGRIRSSALDFSWAIPLHAPLINRAQTQIVRSVARWFCERKCV